jgi:hypothetical protein
MKGLEKTGIEPSALLALLQEVRAWFHTNGDMATRLDAAITQLQSAAVSEPSRAPATVAIPRDAAPHDEYTAAVDRIAYFLRTFALVGVGDSISRLADSVDTEVRLKATDLRKLVEAVQHNEADIVERALAAVDQCRVMYGNYGISIAEVKEKILGLKGQVRT